MSKRMKPSFLVIGGVKCATSSLYRYLNAHPQILPCQTKEPSFFSRHWLRILLGYKGYLSLFPKQSVSGVIEANWLDLGADETMVASIFSKKANSESRYITGEATATTWFAANPKTVHYFFA